MTNIIGKTLLNQFRVDEFIASGGMGAVYKVWDLKRNVPLAMKVLHPELADDPAMFRRFQREANALRKLTHPNIVPFYGLYQSEEILFLLEAFVDGPSLKDVMRQFKGGRMPLRQAFAYLRPITAALSYAHVNGVVHCDVKPGNVMIDSGGTVFLTDFGIARYSEGTVTTQLGAGTPAYMAPEQILGQTVSPSTDVYALSILAFELLAGRRPFTGEEITSQRDMTVNEKLRQAQLSIVPKDPRQFNSEIPAPAAEAILKALAKRPADRYPGALEFWNALTSGSSLQSMGRTPIQNPVAGKKSVIDISSTSGNPARQRTVGILLATVTGVFALSGVMALAWKFLPPQEETPRPVTITFPQSETAVLFLTVTPPVDGFATIQFLETQVAATQTTPTIPLPPTEDFESTTTARARQTEITAAQITPDIKPVTSLPDAWIAFYSNKNGSRDIFLINALTRELKSLITDSSHDKVPAWSPDGRSLAFESNRGSSDAGIFQIFVYNLDSGQSKKLTNDSACSNYNPAWSPDGQKIVFYSRCTDNKNRQILVMDRDGTNKRQLTSSGESWFPAWSPDGSFLAFTSYQNGPIYIMDNNGQNVHFLSDGCSTNFSPDGQWIVFSSTCDDSQILLIHPDGSGKKAIGSLAGQNPSFSPDGQWIAFQSNNDIWVMRLDGSSLEQLTSDHPSSGGVPVWQP